MVNLDAITTIGLIDEVRDRGSLAEWLSDDELIDEVRDRGIEYEFSFSLSDYSDSDLLWEIEGRGFKVHADGDESDLFMSATNIVQKHRCGQEWQADALEVLYNLANKVV